MDTLVAETFALNYGFGTNPSWIDLGYDSTDTSLLKTSVTNENDPVTFNVDNDSYFWELDLKGVRLSTEEADEWGLRDTKARLASGQTCISAPIEHYNLMKDKILQYSIGYYEDSTYGLVVDCE